MSKPLRYGLLAIALAAGWTLFGDRVKARFEEWSTPIQPAGESEARGNPEAARASSPAPRRAAPGRQEGPGREHISQRVRRKVEADLERGVQRSDR